MYERNEQNCPIILAFLILTSVTRLGDFLNSFSYKSSPNILVNFWATSNNTTFM